MSQIYQIKVTLDKASPPIWRRIQVAGNTTLLKLHDILQIVMGWTDSHLHMFTIEGLIYDNPADDEYGDRGTLDEARYRLNQVIHREGQRLRYEYDFGDSWHHTLLVEKILPPQEGARYPICLKGKRACPPEDIGGVWGYEYFLDAIHNPDHDDHEQYMAWSGGKFDPEAFDLEEVNTRLRNMGRGRSAEAYDPWAMDEVGEKLNLDSPWPQTLSEEHQRVAEKLALRMDVVTLLTYLRDNKVTGTQSTGNFPLKAVREICTRFVDPPQLDETIGEHVHRLRSETAVWPLYFRHVLAAVGGLIAGGMDRRWIVTRLGEHFLAASSSLQIWLLLAIWWTRTNWAVAFAYNYGDGFMPVGFPQLALKLLLELPLGVQIPFEPFADRMIEDSRLVWPIENQDNARRILRNLIKRVVINPMVDFGVLQTEYGPHKLLGADYPQLSSFRITSFGKGLLQSLA